MNFTSILKAHVEIWRPYTVLWCGLVSFGGACVSLGALPPLITSLAVFLIPITGWVAGLYGADYLDRKLDKIAKAHRPIPSGRIPENHAIFCTVFLVVIGLFGSYMLGILNLLLALAVMVVGILYSKVFKKQGLLGHLNRGVATWLTILFGCVAVQSSLPFYLIPFSFAFLFHDAASNLMGAIRDIDSDRKGGYHTFPALHGFKKSVLAGAVLITVTIILAVSVPWKYGFLKSSYYYVYSISVITIICLYVYLFLQSEISRCRALKIHEIYVFERITFASAILFGVIEQRVAFFIYGFSLLFTAITQSKLRSRYEFKNEVYNNEKEKMGI